MSLTNRVGKVLKRTGITLMLTVVAVSPAMPWSSAAARIAYAQDSNIVSVQAADANNASAEHNRSLTPAKAGVDSTYEVNGNTFNVVRGFYTHDNDTSLAVFYYSDGLFYTDPYTYNEHLGTASYAFAMSWFYLNQNKLSCGDGNEYYNKHAAARQFLADIGCPDQNIYVNDDMVTKPNVDTIGVTIGSKKLSDADGNQTGDILVPVVVRGAGYEKEWATT